MSARIRTGSSSRRPNTTPNRIPSDIGKVSHTNRFHIGDDANVDQLYEKPEADQKCGGYECDAIKSSEEQDSADFIAGICDQECAHDRGGRPTRAQIGYGGAHVGRDLRLP